MGEFGEVIGAEGESLSDVCERVPEQARQAAGVRQGDVWIVSYIVDGED